MINTVLIGRLGADAQVRVTKSGLNVISFDVAVDMGYKNQAGEKVSRWYQIAYFVKSAGLAPYLTKGSTVAIEGTPEANSYLNKANELVQNVQVVARKIHLIESKKPQEQVSKSWEAIPQGKQLEDDDPFA